MKIKHFLLSIFIITVWCSSTFAVCGGTTTSAGDTYTAYDSSYDCVVLAVSDAETAGYGKTVVVPSGNATWSNPIITTKGTSIQGNKTSTITANFTLANHDFTSDTVWNKGAGWSISDGKATHTPGSTEALSQSVNAVDEGYYYVKFTISGMTAGTVAFSFGGFNGVNRSTNATHGQYFSASNTNIFALTPSSDFNGSIDDVEVYPWLFCIKVDETSINNSEVSQIYNFTIDINNSASFFFFSNTFESFAIAKVYNNAITNMNVGSPCIWQGLFKAVAYNNTFSGYPHTDIYGSNTLSWNNSIFTNGTGDNVYYEDNIITTTGAGVTWANGTTGQGGRSCYRYNTFIDDDDYQASPWLDNHGNQTGTNAPMGFELYGNYFSIKYPTGHTKTPDINRNRGGTGMRWGNYATSSDPESAYAEFMVMQDEYADTLGALTNFECPTAAQDPSLLYPETYTCAQNGQPQHVWNSYYWMNRMATSPMAVDLEAGEGIIENVHFWKTAASFDGTVGVGCGSALPTPWSCTKGVGFWVTSQGNCEDLTGYIGEQSYRTSQSTYLQGTLYKCTATNTWTAYYTPYAYPHPLRGLTNAGMQFRSPQAGDGSIQRATGGTGSITY